MRCPASAALDSGRNALSDPPFRTRKGLAELPEPIRFSTVQLSLNAIATTHPTSISRGSFGQGGCEEHLGILDAHRDKFLFVTPIKADRSCDETEDWQVD